MNFHTYLRLLSEKLGYAKKSGCCHGFSVLWLSACLLKDEDRFNARIKKILSKGDRLIESIEEVKAKKGKDLSEEDRDLLEILAFFDSLELYHLPHHHTPLFNSQTMLIQGDLNSITPFAGSKDLESKGGLASLHKELLLYNHYELIQYLNQLSSILENNQSLSNQPFGILLSSNHHAISLSYTKNNGWRFMDINQYPAKTFKISDTEKLADRIAKGFDLQNNCSSLHLTLLTTKDNIPHSKLNEDLEKLKHSHQLTQGSIERISNDAGFMFHLVQQSHIELINSLHKLGYDVNRLDKNGYAPIHIAGQCGAEKIIIALEQIGANLDLPDQSGNTVLHYAAFKDQGQLLPLLSQLKINLNKKNNDGFSPAHIASVAGYTNFIKLLHAYGADLNSMDDEGNTPMHFASATGNIELLETLEQLGVDLQGINKDNGFNIVHTAARYGQTAILDLATHRRIELNSVDQQGNTPIQIAVKYGQSEFLSALVMRGIAPAATDNNGNTLAHIAAQWGQSAILPELMKLGIDLNKKNKQGQTPTEIAAMYGQSECLEVLGTIGAKLDSTDDHGLTLAHIAALFGKNEIIQVLLKHPIDILQLNKDGHTFLDIAAKNNHDRFLLEMIRLGVDVPTQNIYKQINKNQCNEDTLLLLTNKIKLDEQITPLKEVIDQLNGYGHQILEKFDDAPSIQKGKKAIELAINLQQQLNCYVATLLNPFHDDELESIQDQFSSALAQGYQEMNDHRDVIHLLINIAVAVTGIGLLVILGNYLVTGNIYLSETTRQKHVNEISKAFSNFSFFPAKPKHSEDETLPIDLSNLVTIENR